MKSFPGHIPHVQKKIGDVRIVWFENSGSFVLLDKPAYAVFCLFLKRNDAETIAESCKKRFPGLKTDIPQFVNEITGMIQQLDLPKSTGLNDGAEPFPVFKSKSSQTDIHYRLGRNRITIRYSDTWLKDLIHPLFFHLEADKGEKAERVVELTEDNGWVQLNYNDIVVDTFKADELMYFKGAVLKLLYGLMHHKTAKDWMMTLHSSGIIVDNEAILFIAGSGSGKSTLAALLHTHGYPLLSDDFVAADRQACVYPFPAAVSVKEGSVDLLSGFYPGLLNNRVSTAGNPKKARFIENPNQDIDPGMPYKIKAVVFLNYTPETESSCALLSKKEAIGLLLQEIWVNPTAKNISRFFQWVARTPFYRMNYSDVKEALQCMSKITEH